MILLREIYTSMGHQNSSIQLAVSLLVNVKKKNSLYSALVIILRGNHFRKHYFS